MNHLSQKTTSFCSETRGNAKNTLGIQIIQETFGELLVLWFSQRLNFAVCSAEKSQRSSLQVWGWGRSRVQEAGSPSRFNTSLIDLSVRCSATGEQNSVPSHIVYPGQRCRARSSRIRLGCCAASWKAEAWQMDLFVYLRQFSLRRRETILFSPNFSQ